MSFNYNSDNKDIMVNINGVGNIPARAVRTSRGHFDSSEHYQYAVCSPMSGHKDVSLEHLVTSAIEYKATLERLQLGLDNLHKLINKHND
jgi:hypothetical protein